MKRRDFLKTAGLAATAPLLSLPGIEAASDNQPIKPKLGISTYSYWHFKDPKVPVQTVIEKSAAIGVHGVDILHRQLDSEERGYLQQLKRTAFTNGIDLICLSIHQDFVEEKAE